MDYLLKILYNIFEYFFKLNAPMTAMVVALTGTLVMYLKSRESSIVRPLEVSHHQQTLLKKQMDNSEGPLEEARAKLYGIYRHERRLGLEKTGLTTDEARFRLDNDIETHTHALQLKGVHGVLRNEIRTFFRDNHLADKSETEFEAYVEKRKKQMWTVLVETMSEHWFSGMTDPSRSDLFDVHEVNKDAIFRIMEDIFREGRQIAVKYQESMGQKRSWLRLGKLF